MKRLFVLLLAFVLILPLSACSSGIPEETALPTAETEPLSETDETAETGAPAPDHRVQSPMTERPLYALSAGATPEEMRATAVRAMRDELTVTWVTDETITYGKTGSGEGKTFVHTPYEVYAGLPYTNGTVGLFHWLEYYDFSTGKMVGIPNGEAFNSSLGNSCAASVLWGWSAVSTSISWHVTYWINQSHGAIRVGPYTYPDDVVSYKNYSTERIVAENGTETMLESYAAMHPADCLIYYRDGAGHAMMVISEPSVVRRADGTIDAEKSTVHVQDQRSGIFATSAEYIRTEEGERRHYSGRTDAEVTFNELLKAACLPHTCAEFLGRKAYDLPSASLTGEVTDLASLQNAVVHSVYKICVVTAEIYTPDGNLAFTRRGMTASTDFTNGQMHDYKLSRLSLSPAALARTLARGSDYTLKLTCLDATGTSFDLLTLDFTL